MKTEIIFFKKWLTENKKTLKILLFITCNINNKNVCVCNINDVCKWLDIQTSSVNKNNIKEQLKELQQKNYIEYKEEQNNNYNITITASAADTMEQIKGIYKQWVLEIRQVKINNKKDVKENQIAIDYTIPIKVFIHCFISNIKGVMTQEEIGSKIGVSKDSVCDSLKILKMCKFESITFICDKVQQDVVLYNQTTNQRERKRKNVGTLLNIGLNFN